jgi:hypothetical protein
LSVLQIGAIDPLRGKFSAVILSRRSRAFTLL